MTIIISYLVLGDGDFSFSHDLAKCLMAEQQQQQPPSTRIRRPENNDADSHNTIIHHTPTRHGRHHHVHLTATGFDSLQDLTHKYRDSPFILKKLLQCGLADKSTTQQVVGRVSVNVRHGVNAILPWKKKHSFPHHDNDKDDGDNDNDDNDDQEQARENLASSSSSSFDDQQKQRHHLPKPANIVIFNHPHLGTENAKLHSQFLCHLFHSVNHYWLAQEQQTNHKEQQKQHNNCNVMYLTLVVGQWERWEGLKAAQRHGLILLDRFPFQPPTHCYCSTKKNNYNDDSSSFSSSSLLYQLRRHQTGKSFANRRGAGTQAHEGGGSEMFALGRIKSSGGKVSSLVGKNWMPFWYGGKDSGNVEIDKTATIPLFSCPNCKKEFREKRSMKNHILFCKESAQLEKPSSLAGNKKRPRRSWRCPDCCSCCDEDDRRAVAPSSSSSSSCGNCRIFDTQQALQDHMRAKHTALHTQISPDWSSSSPLLSTASFHPTKDDALPTRPSTTAGGDVNLTVGDTKKDYHSECTVCGEVFGTAVEEQKHAEALIPSTASLTMPNDNNNNNADQDVDLPPVQRCTFCSKPFREIRARLQHENFCKQRPTNTT